MWRRHLRRLLKHAWWISLSSVVLLLVRQWVPVDALRGATDVGGSFLQTFGSMYGIIVAFAIYVTWGQHNDTQVAIEREAVALLELYRLLGWFASWPARNEVRDSLRQYAAAVPALNAPVPHAGTPDDHQLLDRALAGFLSHVPSDATEERLFSSTLDHFHGLNQARGHRVTAAGLRLPEGLRWFVYLGGAICVGALDLVRVESLAIQLVMQAGMTWVVVAAASIMIDLDDPYTGDFIVDWDRFHQAAAQMEHSHCQGPVPSPGAPAR